MHPRSLHIRFLRVAFPYFLALAGIFGVACLFGLSRNVGYHFMWAIAAALIGIANARFFRVRDARRKRLYVLLGFLFVFSQALGTRLQVANASGLYGLLLCLGVGMCSAPAAAYSFIRLTDGLDWLQSADTPSPTPSLRKVFWGTFFTLLLCWTPVFMAYYPGLFAYDVNRQITEIITGQLTNNNPILHTLFLGSLYQLGGALGDYNTGIALAVILQMIALAATFAWLLRYLATLQSARIFRLLTLIGFALLPIHALLAISLTKDTLFTATMLLFGIKLHQLGGKPKLLDDRKWFVTTVILIGLLCLLRNNAFFGIAMCIPLGRLIIPKQQRQRGIALVTAGLLVFLGVGQGLRAITKADGINSVELVSMPSQQMARVFHIYKDVYPPCEEIEAYLPTAPYYRPDTADAVKTFAKIKGSGQLWGFIKLWGKVGLRYPLEYLDAFLLTTRGYWWLDDTTHARIYGEGLETRQGYLLTDTKEGFGIQHQSLMKPLESWLETLFSANEYQRIPVVSLLFAPSLYGWLTLFALVRAIEHSRRAVIVVSCFLLCYMAPLWFGACVLIRYAYPLVVCLPLLLFAKHTPDVT